MPRCTDGRGIVDGLRCVCTRPLRAFVRLGTGRGSLSLLRLNRLLRCGVGLLLDLEGRRIATLVARGTIREVRGGPGPEDRGGAADPVCREVRVGPDPEDRGGAADSICREVRGGPGPDGPNTELAQGRPRSPPHQGYF